MRKFNRVYQLSVETGGHASFITRANPIDLTGAPGQPNAFVTIKLPNAISFEINRQSIGSSQNCTIRVWDLPEEIRNAIGKDAFETRQFRALQLWAGYSNETGHSVPLIFNGNVLSCYSCREGENWVTEIQGQDGGFQIANGNGFSMSAAQSFSAQEAILLLAKALPRLVTTPIIGSFPSTNKRGEVYFGNTWNLIQKKSNGNATIDNGQVKVLTFGECFENTAFPMIDDSSGLIGTPKVRQLVLDVEMLFEPSLTVGQVVRLNVSTLPKLKRYWKVFGIQHNVGITTFGPVGQAVTRVTLFYNHEDLTVVAGQPFLNPLLSI